jgi:mevalonyl-CoA ligase
MVLDRVRQILSHISQSTDPSSTSPYPGLSYHIGPTNKPLKHVTLGQLLREQVSLNGHYEALVSAWQGIRWTYRDLDEKSDELARSFWGLGVRKGDRMAIMAGNCGEYVLVCIG